MIHSLSTRWQESGVALIAARELAGLRRWSRWTRWLPLFYLVLLAPAMVLCGALVFDLGMTIADDAQPPLLAAAVGMICPLNALAALLGLALPWITPAVTAPGIAREWEVKSWDLLRVTTIGERDLVLGKLVGGLGRLWPALLLLALLTPFRALAGMVGGTTVSGNFLLGLVVPTVSAELLGWPPLLAATLSTLTNALAPWPQLVLHAAAGLVASALARSTGAAIALAYGVVAVLWVTLAIARVVIVWGGALLIAIVVAVLSGPDDRATYLGGWIVGGIVALGPLARMVVELGLAGALVRAAIQRVERS